MIKEYENLANAIVMQAVKDWRHSVKKLKKNPHCATALSEKRDCERFFHSAWFEALTSVDGEVILRKLKQEAEDDDG